VQNAILLNLIPWSQINHRLAKTLSLDTTIIQSTQDNHGDFLRVGTGLLDKGKEGANVLRFAALKAKD